MHARRTRITKQQVEEIESFKLTSPCFLQTIPCRERSKKRFKRNNAVSKLKKELDSVSFNCYMENLWKSFSEDKKMSFAYLDSLWFTMYTDASSGVKVLEWIKRKHIFSKKYVLVPIVRWCHWSLLIFCHFGESLLSENITPCMLLLDSLEMASPKRLEPDIRKFVWDIYESEGRPENKHMISQIPLLVPKVNLALVLENFLFIAGWIFTHVCFWNFPGATTEKWCRMWQLCPLLYKFVCARCSRELSHGGLPLFCRFFLLLARLLNEASIVCFHDRMLFALNCR
ncbi:ubiquitin-like-specific protease 2B [Populus alba x Populus x berolinensis]|nr:ubiquitin-like-specific protease 2B [Populus alba x Populus x berolinensis]